MAVGETVIETVDLKKTYRTLLGKASPALQGVSLRVERGHIFGLIGPNGAGKTTLVKILLGICRQTAGSVRLLGGSPGRSSVRRRVGYLPEQMNLPEHMKATDFLRYMGRLNSVDRRTLRQRVPALLAQVGLADVRKPVKQ